MYNLFYFVANFYSLANFIRNGFKKVWSRVKCAKISVIVIKLMYKVQDERKKANILLV